MNVALLVWGEIRTPHDFPSYLLAIFICNFLLYTAFYIIMKLYHRERLLVRPLVYILLASAFWAFSLYFFTRDLTSWMQTPAASRERNHECILLDFYDSHDVWHFLSSISLFFSFMILLTIDDDLCYTPQEKIHVF